MTEELREQAQSELQLGKIAFERGDYRRSIQHFETTLRCADIGVRMQGEAQVWLITAYEAAGDRTRALDLCRIASQHPDWDTRKQAKRLLYILEAPKLRMHPEWLTEIPDLTELGDNDNRNWSGSKFASTAPPKPPEEQGYVIPEPADPTKVEIGDDRSLWLALGAAILVVLGLLTWSQLG